MRGYSRKLSRNEYFFSRYPRLSDRLSHGPFSPIVMRGIEVPVARLQCSEHPCFPCFMLFICEAGPASKAYGSQCQVNRISHKINEWLSLETAHQFEAS